MSIPASRTLYTRLTPIMAALLALAPPTAQAQDKAAAPTTVVVTAPKPKVANRIDRKIYRVDQDLQSTTGSASDVLGNLPSVDVDIDGNVALRGDSSVTILIDGKPSPQMSGSLRGASLQQFPADQIERIEVITNPSAQFKPDGTAGVINIITKKRSKRQPTAVLQANLGDSGRYNAGASGVATFGKATIDGGLNIRQDKRSRESHMERRDVATGAVISTSDSSQWNNRLSRSVRAGVTYEATAADKLSLSGNLSRRTSDRFSTESTLTGATRGGRFGDGTETETDKEVALSYDHAFSEGGHELSMTLQHSVSSEREAYRYRNEPQAPGSYGNYEDISQAVRFRTTEFSTDYVWPISDGRELKVGYDFQRDLNDFDNQGANAPDQMTRPVPDPLLTNRFRYTQSLHAAYATYETRWGALGLMTGLRVEQAEVGTRDIANGVAGRQSYLRAYPTLHLAYELDDTQTLSASYSRRVSRPEAEDLNPFIDYRDPHNLRAGNPDLRPQQTDSFELGYLKGDYGLTAYYRVTRDGFTEVTRPISDDVVLITKENLGRSRAGGLEFTAAGKLTPKIGYTLSGNVFYREIDAGVAGTQGRSGTSSTLKTSFDYKPTTATTWQISASHTGKRLTAQGYVTPVTTVNAGFRHQLRPELAIVVTGSDLFNGQRSQSYIVTPELSTRYDRYQKGRVLYIGLNYTFGAQKKSKTDFQYE